MQLGSSAGLGVRKNALLAPPGSSREIHSLGRVQGLSLVGGPCLLLSKDEVLVVVTWNHDDLVTTYMVTKCNKLRLLVNIAEIGKCYKHFGLKRNSSIHVATKLVSSINFFEVLLFILSLCYIIIISSSSISSSSSSSSILFPTQSL